jgi:hypothetical protein
MTSFRRSGRGDPAGVIPTWPTSGSVYVQWGMTRSDSFCPGLCGDDRRCPSGDRIGIGEDFNFH